MSLECSRRIEREVRRWASTINEIFRKSKETRLIGFDLTQLPS